MTSGSSDGAHDSPESGYPRFPPHQLSWFCFSLLAIGAAALFLFVLVAVVLLASFLLVAVVSFASFLLFPVVWCGGLVFFFCVSCGGSSVGAKRVGVF